MKKSIGKPCEGKLHARFDEGGADCFAIFVVNRSKAIRLYSTLQLEIIKIINIVHRNLLNHFLTIILGLTFFAACKNTNQAPIIDGIAIADETNTSEWLAYGRTHSEQRYSPLNDINTQNVANLKVDWFMDLPNDVALVSTPLVVNGVLYFTGTMNVVRAVNAVSGKLLWEFDPEVGKHISNKRQIGWKHNRGLTYYKGKVFAATWDGRLIAIDAETGAEIWTAVTFDPNTPLYITGAPKAFAGKVLIGNGGTEQGPSRGFVTAYNAETGKEAWKFYIVPGDPSKGFENEAMEMAAKTWTGEWWKHGGGGNAWHGFTYDHELDFLYIGTGNGSPWNRKIRTPKGGDNLFLCSIVALNPHTGEYIWHYQTTPGESWDYNSSMDIVLADLTIDNKVVKVILHAPKNGFFYVLNRETGRLISAEPFAKTTWASHIDKETGRPVEIKGARYEDGPAHVSPTPYGAHTWHAMSYNPQTGLVYIPTLHGSVEFSDSGIDLSSFKAIKFSGGVGVGGFPNKFNMEKTPASLQAWDPVKQKQVWSIPQDNFWNAGTLTTGGNLVFQGRSDGKFLAYDAENGDILWTFDTRLGISAPPITYKIDGKQYVSLLVGFGGAYAGLGKKVHKLGWAYRRHTRRLITFSLTGNADMPDLPAPFYPKPIVDSTFTIDVAKAQLGANLYDECGSCHGPTMYSGGMAPDLRASPISLNKETFKAVVKEGYLNQNGMPSFPNISDEQLEALRHFIRKERRKRFLIMRFMKATRSIKKIKS